MMNTAGWLQYPDDRANWWDDLCCWWSEEYPDAAPTDGWIVSVCADEEGPLTATIPIRAGWNHWVFDQDQQLFDHVVVLASIYQAVVVSDIEELYDIIHDDLADIEIDQLRSDFDLSPDADGTIPATVVPGHPDRTEAIAAMTEPDELLEALEWNEGRLLELFGERRGINHAAFVAQELGHATPEFFEALEAYMVGIAEERLAIANEACALFARAAVLGVALRDEPGVETEHQGR